MNKNNTVQTGDSERRAYNFEEAYELTGNGWYNYSVVLTCGLILLNVNMESIGMSYVITAAQCDLNLNSHQKGLVTASCFVGIISTSFIWGFLGDNYGRKTVMVPALLASAFVSICSSLATNVYVLAGLRMLTGCFVSASSATVYAYLGEMHSNSRRSSAIAWGSTFISFSFITLPALAWLIIPGTWRYDLGVVELVPWRVFVWSWGAPAIVAALILMLMLPESPRYLYAAKGPEKALPVLAKMYAWNYGCKCEEYPYYNRSLDDYPEESNRLVQGETSKQTQDLSQVDMLEPPRLTEQMKPGLLQALKNMVSLLKPPLLRCILISFAGMFALFMLSSGLIVWVPDILNEILKRKDMASVTICQIMRDRSLKMGNETTHACQSSVEMAVFPISMSMGAVFALTYMLIGFLITRIGKKTLFCSICVICSLSTIASAYIPHGVAATMLLVVALASGCTVALLTNISIDVYPTALRAQAMCVMYMVGRLGAAFGSYLLGAMIDTHCQLAISGFGVITVCATMLVLLWPNTKLVREKMEGKGFIY